jgi:hypothetical protein
MLVSTKMITGFNTDVQHEGHVYHVQTEDRGLDNPVLESLVYIGGTIVAKKRTPYSEQLSTGATEDVISSLLKRQHQVIIAAIKAGRIEDLIRHSARQQTGRTKPLGSAPIATPPLAKQTSLPIPRKPDTGDRKILASPNDGGRAEAGRAPFADSNQNAVTGSGSGRASGLDLDKVVSDYLTRSTEQQKIELKVLTPEVFTAGKSVGLRVLVSCGAKPEDDAIVTIKVIGTAFKPQVYIGRSARDGVASFSLAIPSFTAGTAAIVIEAQSKRGRGELKQLIRRS